MSPQGPSAGIDSRREPPDAGLEGLRGVLARFPALPVVVLVGWNDEALGLEALQHGAQDYIVKQEEERRLAKALRFAVERKRGLDTLRQLEKAVETTQLGISVTDPAGRILYVNRAEAELHGYQPAEMLGMDARSLSPRSEWRALTPEDLRTCTPGSASACGRARTAARSRCSSCPTW